MTDGMAEISHFAYGWFNPVVAFSLAFLGSILGLGCTARSRQAPTPRRRARWLLLAAVAIGGAGIWLMHFMAMLGFDVASSPVRYGPWPTVASMLIAVAATGGGLFLAAGWPHGWGESEGTNDSGEPERASGRGARLPKGSVPRLVAGGAVTGLGTVAMHYTGMAAVHVAGELRYDPLLVVASTVIALVAAVGALWCTLWVRRVGHTVLAALIMAAAIWGMHYTGMAAVDVDPAEPGGQVPGQVPGVSALLLIIPITLVTAGALLATALSALQAMTEEELGAAPERAPEPAVSPEPGASPELGASPQAGTSPRPGGSPQAASHPLAGAGAVAGPLPSSPPDAPAAGDRPDA